MSLPCAPVHDQSLLLTYPPEDMPRLNHLETRGYFRRRGSSQRWLSSAFSRHFFSPVNTPRRRRSRAATPFGDEGRDRTDAVGDEIGPGEHGEHAGGPARRRPIDRHHVGVRVRRAHERGVGLPRRIEVVGKAAVPGQETMILPPLDRRADAEAGHGLWTHPRSYTATAAASDILAGDWPAVPAEGQPAGKVIRRPN